MMAQQLRQGGTLNRGITVPGPSSARVRNAQTAFHASKDAAVARSVEVGKRYRGQVRIKGHDGRIPDERTYTRDPYPPKG